jgi:uncharacterized protein YceK
MTVGDANILLSAHVKRSAACALMATALVMGGCVSVVRYTPMIPSETSARAAVEANLALSMDRWAGIQTHLVYDAEGRGVDGEKRRRNAPFEMCARDGRRIDGYEPRISQETICVKEGEGIEKCYRYDELQSIGHPRDGTAIGYYSVPIWMKCRPAT